ncbi:SUMF1/EgtB/PvdO family nonheme iron enzyme [Gemmata sp. SH-PL17]|uniref:SUMF1/EgtB/PvdO family nonheme iron enzyme n=1 Tax=Gemmata sp. SH-PL17 TaxID=1630693 RepID=UPI00194F4644
MKAQASARVLRGGSWNNDGRNCRSANRNRTEPDDRNQNIGFRLAAAPTRDRSPRRNRPFTRPRRAAGKRRQPTGALVALANAPRVGDSPPAHRARTFPRQPTSTKFKRLGAAPSSTRSRSDSPRPIIFCRQEPHLASSESNRARIARPTPGG